MVLGLDMLFSHSDNTPTYNSIFSNKILGHVNYNKKSS